MKFQKFVKMMLKLIKTTRLKSIKDLVDVATYLTNFYKKYLQHLKRKEKMTCTSCHFGWFSSSYLFGFVMGIFLHDACYLKSVKRDESYLSTVPNSI